MRVLEREAVGLVCGGWVVVEGSMVCGGWVVVDGLAVEGGEEFCVRVEGGEALCAEGGGFLVCVEGLRERGLEVLRRAIGSEGVGGSVEGGVGGRGVEGVCVSEERRCGWTLADLVEVSEGWDFVEVSEGWDFVEVSEGWDFVCGVEWADGGAK